MTRREFLKRAAAGGGLVLGPRWLPGCGGGKAPARAGRPSSQSILNRSAGSSPVDTIVVMMMENRSFDHYLGWLGSDDGYLEAGRTRHGRDFTVEARNDFAYPDPESGEMVSTYHLPSNRGEADPYRGCGHPDPGHGIVQGRAQRDGGFLAPESGNDEYALGYFVAEDLPFYAPLARHFTICDRYHCSLMSGTYPNRTYLHSAQSGGLHDFGLEVPLRELGFDWPTIWDRLIAAGVPCAYYGYDAPVTAFWGARLLPITRPVAAYFVDAAAGLLPRVVFVDPGFISGLRTDDHPHGDMRVAQKYASAVFAAFQRSPHWQRGAFILTYDGWGGFFDHVRPPELADDHASSVATWRTSRKPVSGYRPSSPRRSPAPASSTTRSTTMPPSCASSNGAGSARHPRNRGVGIGG